MQTIKTSIAKLVLVHPDAERDAPFALKWFTSPHGKETLLLMGNAEHTIEPPSLEEQVDIIKEFLEFEKQGKQLTWMIRYDNKTIGAVWLELQDTPYVRSPAFHIMIGNKAYRGKGFGKAIVQEMITYTKNTLKSKMLYSRHLTSNEAITRLNSYFGFRDDGPPYTGSDGLEFQNVKLEL